MVFVPIKVVELGQFGILASKDFIGRYRRVTLPTIPLLTASLERQVGTYPVKVSCLLLHGAEKGGDWAKS